MMMATKGQRRQDERRRLRKALNRSTDHGARARISYGAKIVVSAIDDEITETRPAQSFEQWAAENGMLPE